MRTQDRCWSPQDDEMTMYKNYTLSSKLGKDVLS